MAKREPALGEPTLSPEGPPAFAAEPLGLLAVRLVAAAREAGARGLLHVAGSERRAEALGRLAARLDPDLLVVPFPPWDCLPYERVSPSAEAMGRRMAALRRLAGRGDAPCLVISTPDALLQRVPPREALAEARAGACRRRRLRSRGSARRPAAGRLRRSTTGSTRPASAPSAAR